MTNPKVKNTNHLQLTNLTRERLKLLEEQGLARTDPENDLEKYYRAEHEDRAPHDPVYILLESISCFYSTAAPISEIENTDNIECTENLSTTDIDDEEWVFLFAWELGLDNEQDDDLYDIDHDYDLPNPSEMEEAEDILQEMFDYNQNLATSEENGWFYDESDSDWLNSNTNDCLDNKDLGWAWKESEATNEYSVNLIKKYRVQDEEIEEYLKDDDEIHDNYIDEEVRRMNHGSAE